jgi:nucleotide-binding universal stress UspA family protein
MNDIFRILCAVDFSRPAHAAFEQALALSRARKAELTVVHAVPKDQPFRWHARERIGMIAALRQLATDAGVRFKASVQHGDPAGVILLHARARRPHLLVIGTHGRKGLARVRAGSVAETVTLRATCPVLIVPEKPKGTVAPASISFGHMLCAVDFSPASNAALAQAVSLAEENNGRMTLVHVAKGTSREDLSRYRYRLRVPESQTLIAQDAWRRLQDAIPAGLRRPGRVHARVVTGEPSAEIVRMATDVGADLIVLGVSCRGLIGRYVFGATATRVMRSAGRLVLAVPEGSRSRAGSLADSEPLAMAA